MIFDDFPQHHSKPFFPDVANPSHWRRLSLFDLIPPHVNVSFRYYYGGLETLTSLSSAASARPPCWTEDRRRRMSAYGLGRDETFFFSCDGMKGRASARGSLEHRLQASTDRLVTTLLAESGPALHHAISPHAAAEEPHTPPT
jgi:hypothetical protein